MSSTLLLPPCAQLCNRSCSNKTHTHKEEEEEEEEEEDLFVFNDTIEGPRAPAVKPGRVTQACRECLSQAGRGRRSTWEKIYSTDTTLQSSDWQNPPPFTVSHNDKGRSDRASFVKNRIKLASFGAFGPQVCLNSMNSENSCLIW